jgi:hypothetical protein
MSWALLLPGSIEAIKFEDTSGDGIYQPGEPRLANWSMHLIDAMTGDTVRTAITAPDGRDWFTSVLGGT